MQFYDLIIYTYKQNITLNNPQDTEHVSPPLYSTRRDMNILLMTTKHINCAIMKTTALSPKSHSHFTG